MAYWRIDPSISKKYFVMKLPVSLFLSNAPQKSFGKVNWICSIAKHWVFFTCLSYSHSHIINWYFKASSFTLKIAIYLVSARFRNYFSSFEFSWSVNFRNIVLNLYFSHSINKHCECNVEWNICIKTFLQKLEDSGNNLFFRFCTT